VHSTIKALLALTGVHAHLAFGLERPFWIVSRSSAAFFLTFLGSMAIVAMAAFGTHHIGAATATGYLLVQFGTAFLAFVCHRPA